MRSTKILTSVWVVALLLGTALNKDTTSTSTVVTTVEIDSAAKSDPSEFQWLEDNLFNQDQHWEIISRSYEGDQTSTSAKDCPQGKDCTDCNCDCVFQHGCAQPESHFYTFGGETIQYTIDANGKVTSNGEVICESGGEACLNDYQNNQFKVVTYDGQDYELYVDGSVYENGALICASGGCQCLLNHIYDNTYETYTYNYNGIELVYHVYQDGTVLDLQGNVVTTYGTSSLVTYIETTVITSIQKLAYNINGVDRTFSIVMDRVTEDPHNTLICETGGADCLHQWVEDQMYSLVQYSVGSTIYVFRIYPDGSVTNEEGTEVICATGGEACLLEYFNAYVESTYQSTQVTYNIDGEDHSFLIFGDGRVETLITETVVCETGGQTCLDAYVESIMYSMAQYTIEGTVYTFKIYPDGRVEDEFGVVVCETGGETCLQTYINDFSLTLQTTQISYNINGVDHLYIIDYYGKVTTEDGTVICESGGQTCLDAYVESQMSQYVEYNIDGTIYTFEITSSGSVLASDGSVVCASGGQACLDSYIQEFMLSLQVTHVSYNINGVDTLYIIDASGRVTTEDGTVICESGGQACLDTYVQGQMSQMVEYDIDGTTYTFEITSSGSVISSSGTVVCETGGQACLDSYVQQLMSSLQQSHVIYNINGVDTLYIIEASGRVTTEDGTVICESGGQPCLDAYVQSQMSQFVEYNIDGTIYTYEITSSGSVLYSDGRVICESGGQACLDSHVEEMMLSRQQTHVSYDIDGVVTVFIIDGNGRVTMEDGTVICESGGQTCLDGYAQSQLSQSVQYNIDGTIYTFEITSSGSVLDSDGVVICESGGQACLDSYVESWMASLSTTQINYDINGVSTIFLIDGQGKVTEEDGTVVCETGGIDCLNAYVQSITPSIMTINGVNYLMYQDGSVYNADGTVMICATGGQDCLLAELGFALGQEVSTTNQAGKYSVLGALSMALVLGGAYLYQKRQSKQQELFLESNVRQSLLH